MVGSLPLVWVLVPRLADASSAAQRTIGSTTTSGASLYVELQQRWWAGLLLTIFVCCLASWMQETFSGETLGDLLRPVGHLTLMGIQASPDLISLSSCLTFSSS